MAHDPESRTSGLGVRDDLGKLLLMDAADVDALPWEPLHDDPKLQHKVLWRSGSVVLGLIRVEPGGENAAHVHQAAQHHILVTQGEATMVGKRLGGGGYAYIPPGGTHDVVDVGPEGVTFFYTYRPVEDVPHNRARAAAEDASNAVAF